MEGTSARITVKFQRRMGIGASTEVLTEDEINMKEESIKKERSKSKSKKGSTGRKKRSKSRSGRSSSKSRSRGRSSKKPTKASKRMGKEERDTSKEEKEISSMASEGNTGGNLEERQILALESVADSMDALVRASMIAMMREMVMVTLIKVQ